MTPGPKLLFFIALLLLAMILSCGDSRSGSSRYNIDAFLNYTRFYGGSFSHDDTHLLVSSDKSGIFNLHVMSIATGKFRPISDSDSASLFAISFFPEDNRVLFHQDRSGDEIWHIYLRESSGAIRDLTPIPGARATFLQWSDDRQSFYYLSNQRDARYLDLYEMHIADFRTTLIFRNEDGYSVKGVSPNRRWIALHKSQSRDDSDMYLKDLLSGETRHLSAHNGDINFFPVTFSKDSRYLFYLTDEESEFRYLKRYDLVEHAGELVSKTNWDIDYVDFSRSGRYRVSGVNQDGRTRIKIFDEQKNSYLQLPDLPEGEMTGVRFSQDETAMVCYVSGAKMPNDLYLYELQSGKLTRLTHTLNRAIHPDDLLEGEIVRYKSFDGLYIPAILYQPENLSGDEPLPAIIWVHGGPGGQSKMGYHPLLQCLANQGYVVMAVNNRGSSGYGKTFFKLDDRRHGQDDLQDCVAARDYLIQSGIADPDRVGIMGFSYGGYLSLAALAFRPETFTAGVDLFGVADWIHTLENIPPWWEAYRAPLLKELGDPVQDADYLRRISPIFHLDNIVRPLLVIQGAKDARVSPQSSQHMVEQLRSQGVDVEYLLFEDEGHGFLRKENQLTGYRAVIDFCDRYIRKDDASQ